MNRSGSTPRIRRTLFVLAVPDLQRSAAYYRDVLGCEIHEIGDPGWRLYRLGDWRVMAGECPDAIPPAALGDHSYYGYIVLGGPGELDAYHDRVTAAGAEIIKPLRDEPWQMREFGVRTADGHRIMFGADLPAR